MATTQETINAFLNKLPELAKHIALTLYGHNSIAKRAFEIETAQHAVAHYKQIHLTDGGMAEQIKPLLHTAQHKIFCAASIPSSTNPNGGHAVALVIDPAKKSITFNDPYGTNPPSELQEALETEFPNFTIAIDQQQQQRDQQSCALITAMNLAAYAKGENPDPNIQDKLWSIRIRHAPEMIEVLKQEVEAENQRQLAAPPPPTINGFREIKTEEAPTSLIDSFNNLDESNPDMLPDKRLVILLAKLGQPTQP